MHVERARQPPGDHPGGLGPRARGAFGAMALLIFISSVALFFLFPRVGLGFFAPKERTQTAMIGFSDEVSLGGHGVLRSNPEVVIARHVSRWRDASTSAELSLAHDEF